MSAAPKMRRLSGRRFQSKGSTAEKREKRSADNIVFDSILERDHYLKLKTLLRAGKIRDLEYHPVFIFVVNGIHVGEYEADFLYIETETGARRVEDVKAFERNPRTGELRYLSGPDYAWQKSLMLACHNIEVHEV